MNDNQLQQLLQAINTLQDLGKVAYFNKGAYNSETTYEINDVVTYQGSSYVSLGNNNQGNLPTNATYWSVVALKGDKGETGKPFVIEKTYISIQEMVADYDNMNVNDYVMISGSIEDEQNATLWTKTETPAPTYKWVYLADFSGASGITGQTPNIQIGNVTEGNEPAVTRRQGSTNENPILDFVLKTGATGATGATGNGISQVSKTSTSGLTDTYTIEYTSGNSTTFDVTNGKGITSIAKTGTSGLVDTYTITYNDGTTSTFTITNGEDGEVTQAQLDETNNQVAKANMVYNALPKVSDEGDSLTLDGTANCPMKMELKGNTEQTTYTGKNLSYFNRISRYGITFEGNDVNVVNPTNYLYASEEWNMRHDSNLSNKTYTIYSLANGTTGDKPITFQIGKTGDSYAFKHILSANTTYKDDLKVQTVTLGENEVFTLIDIFVSGSTTANVNYKFMVVEGSYTEQTIGDYEPYVGGIPSPNPDYPQDVRVVTSNNSVKVVGKNLLNIANLTATTKNGITLTKNNDGTITLNGTASADANFSFAIDSIVASSSYKVQLYKKGGSFTNNYVSIYMSVDSAFSDFDLLSLASNSMIAMSLGNKTYTYSQIKVNSGVVCNNLVVGCQIVNDASITEYQPYQSQTYPINLGTIELCKIGSYQDYIYKDSSKWYKHSEICKVVLDGSEDWSYRSFPDNSYLSIKMTLNAGANGGFCNYFISNNNYDAVIEHMTISKQWRELCFAILKSRLTSPDGTGFRNWLSTHNTIVYYVLATPTNEEITDTTLISQLNAIENAVSYDTQTNIVQENYSEPFIINAECVRSLKDIFELIDNS